MALIHSLFELSGTVGDATFSRRNGKTHLRLKPSFSYDRWKTAETTRRSRENALEFGGASAAAAMLYRQLRGTLSGHLAPYAHNTIAATIRNACKRMRPSHPHPDGLNTRALPLFPAGVVAKSLTGLQLGKAAHHMVPDITHIKDSGTTTHYRISGLDRIAQSLPRLTKRGHTRQIRIRLQQARVRDLILRDGQYQLPDGLTAAQAHLAQGLPPLPASRWFDTDLLSHAPDHIDIPVPPPIDKEGSTPGDHIITFAVIEWRERHGTRSPRLLKEHTTLLILDAAAVFPDETPKQARTQRKPRTHIRRILRALRAPVKPRPTPIDRLKAALSPLQKE